MRVVKGDWYEAVSRNNRKKGGPVSHVKEPYEIAMVLPQFRTKWLLWEFELKGVGDCGLVYGYFIFIEC